VRSWEGGTVLDALPVASNRALDEGSRGAAATLWPADAGPLPTADRPALAMVLVPASSGAGGAGGTGTGDAAGAAPTWVFPFDSPPAPGDGDNQALAVNTEDGSVAYDVAFALVWADGDTVLNRNEAYALASCTGCRTVAVAFQVVLLVGSVDVVVPQNISAAVNYACLECVTYALATQLVVSLPGPLSDAAAAQLAEVWADLRAFGEQIEGVPLAELRERLTGFEEQILAVVREEGAGDTGGGTSTGDTSEESSGDSSDDGAGGTGGSGAPADAPASGAASTTAAPSSTQSDDLTGGSGDTGSSSASSATATSPADTASSTATSGSTAPAGATG
jgi:putative peptide zinc metalloprotease protein